MAVKIKDSPTGQIAQLVEHRIENPGVGGSNPPLTTSVSIPVDFLNAGLQV